MTVAYSTATSWTNFQTSFEYNIILVIKERVPKEIRRDLNKLKKQSEELSDFLQTTIRSDNANVNLDNVCSHIE
jgi:hypothetical protein